MSLPIKDFEEKKDFPTFQPSNDEKVKLDFLERRFSAMIQGRQAIDKDWDLYQEMYEAVLKPYGDDRSKSTVPLLRAMVRSYKSDANRIPTEFLFKGETEKSSFQAKVLEYAWKNYWRKNNIKKVMSDQEDIAAVFGGSVLQTGFESYDIVQYDPTINDDMSMEWKERKIHIEKIMVNCIDCRRFYLDNQTIDSIEQASDCRYQQWMSYEDFQMFSENPLYKNIEFVAPKEYNGAWQPYTTQIESARKGDFVELRHYWNVRKDMYCVVANGVLVREHHMIDTIDGIKALPFVVRPFDKKIGSYRGVGFGELALLFNSEINDIREMIMDGQRRANNPTIALGDGVDFNGKKFARNNEILRFTGNLSQNFQQLAGVPPSADIYNYLESIYKDIAIFACVDLVAATRDAEPTAYQTNAKLELAQKGINTILQQRDLSMERLANLLKDNLQKFFARKGQDGKYPEIEIEDEEEVNGKFKESKGEKSILKITPEKLRGDIYIDVFTNINKPISDVAERQAQLELAQTMPIIVQGAQMAEQAGANITAKDYINAYLDKFDFNKTFKGDVDKDELKQGNDSFLQGLRSMMGSNPLAQQLQGGKAQQQPQQALSTMPNLAPIL